ncbi:MAG: ParB/RepB/Spo0J family partition protein [Desulfuromonadaceae bacterium]|nr:ParB/RepB/Spo0J family partition protein [Desulfuromonadaceae bacterium]
MVKKIGLGRGMGALLETMENHEGSKYYLCPIEEIRPNSNQPRKHFDQQKLDELVASIQEKGIIQPLLVRKMEGFFEIVAGERRWRAAQKAGLLEIPVIIESIGEEASLEIALIENLQREDLNPIEEGDAYRFLIEKYGFSQDEVARRVGKERSTVANALRLLKLPEDVRKDVVLSRLSMGQARALLSLDSEEDIREARDTVVSKELSVRETESLVKRIKKKSSFGTRRQVPGPPAEIEELSGRLKQVLGTKVRIQPRGRGGKIEISYFSAQELNRLLILLGI